MAIDDGYSVGQTEAPCGAGYNAADCKKNPEVGRTVNKTAMGDAEYRKQRPVFSGVLNYFPDALLEVALVSYRGNQQHNPGEPLHWAKGKSGDHSDALVRHLLDHGKRDSDGMRHSAKVAWRALALLQEEIEKEQGLAWDNKHAGRLKPHPIVQGADPGQPMQPQTEAQYKAMPYGGQPLPAGGCSQEPNEVCCGQPAVCEHRSCLTRADYCAKLRQQHQGVNYLGRTENAINEKNATYEKARRERAAIEVKLIEEMRIHGFGNLLKEGL